MRLIARGEVNPAARKYLSAMLRFVAELVVNFALPYAIFSYEQPHAGDVKALLASSIPPLIWSVVEVVWKRRIDALSIIVLAGIALGLLAFIGSGSAKFLQLRENLVTAVIGLVFLGSVVFRRPLIYELSRATLSRQSSEKLAEFESMKENPGFRHAMVVMTIVWGFGLLVQTAIACALVFALSIKTYLIVGPIVGYAGFALLALWTFLYVQHRRRLRAAKG
jgi:hypothetical protein